MAVEPLGPIEPVSSLRGMKRLASTPPSEVADSANLSTEDRVVAEFDAAMETSNSSPDARVDLVADVRGRLNAPNYLNAKVVDRIAERIQDPFGT